MTVRVQVWSVEDARTAARVDPAARRFPDQEAEDRAALHTIHHYCPDGADDLIAAIGLEHPGEPR